MRSDIVPGAVFPDYELSDHTAKHRKLSELQGQHPMVLVLSRGGYCPKDRRQAEGLVQLHREMEVGYCRLVTISTDSIVETNEFRSGVGAHWPFLSDPRRTVQKDLDIAEYTDPVHNPMIPHTIVLEPGLVVHKVYNGYWFFGRPTTEDLRQDLRAVTRKCRPDWDITTPELKAAWEQGHKERPKDRRQAEGLVQLHREMEVGYCRLVTISTDSIVETNEFRSGVGAHWPFLSDPRRTVQKDLDIAEYTDPVHNPMIPHTIVLEPGLVVHKVYNGYWFFGRPTTEDLRQDLRAVTRKCRPDWDITTPELKAAWEQGHKERFYPYGKTYAQTIGEQD